MPKLAALLFAAKLVQPRARELVDAALGSRDPTSITKVRLSNKSYSVEAAKVIGEALEKMTSVTEVSCRRRECRFFCSVTSALGCFASCLFAGRKINRTHAQLFPVSCVCCSSGEGGLIHYSVGLRQFYFLCSSSRLVQHLPACLPGTSRTFSVFETAELGIQQHKLTHPRAVGGILLRAGHCCTAAYSRICVCEQSFRSSRPRFPTLAREPYPTVGGGFLLARHLTIKYILYTGKHANRVPVR